MVLSLERVSALTVPPLTLKFTVFPLDWVHLLVVGLFLFMAPTPTAGDVASLSPLSWESIWSFPPVTLQVTV